MALPCHPIKYGKVTLNTLSYRVRRRFMILAKPGKDKVLKSMHQSVYCRILLSLSSLVRSGNRRTCRLGITIVS